MLNNKELKSLIYDIDDDLVDIIETLKNDAENIRKYYENTHISTKYVDPAMFVHAYIQVCIKNMRDAREGFNKILKEIKKEEYGIHKNNRNK